MPMQSMANLVAMVRIFSGSLSITIMTTTTLLVKELSKTPIISSGSMFVSTYTVCRVLLRRRILAHCLDIIRQQLMCTVDTGVFGQVWWNPEKPEAYVDFNTLHKCKNFDAIRQWAQDHQLPKVVPNDFLQPPEKGDTVYEIIP